MPLKDELLTEYDEEMAATRKVLEQVPTDRLDWKPHPKSMTVGRLATHVADLARWTAFTLEGRELDFADPGDALGPRQLDSTQMIVDWFDQYAKEGRTTLESMDDARWNQTWTLRQGEEVWFALPKWNVFRRTILNHMIHHRAQLTVFLRLLDAHVPGTYGPSADEM